MLKQICGHTSPCFIFHFSGTTKEGFFFKKLVLSFC